MRSIDELIRDVAGDEPEFDPAMASFLDVVRAEAHEINARHGLVECVELGGRQPWLWKLVFSSTGLVNIDHELAQIDRHTVSVRFLPGYLRRVDRFQTLALIEPLEAFHPNIRHPFLCVEVYPAQPLREIVESLHSLFTWRLKNLREEDALNPDACRWGRAHIDELPIDDRPLFGSRLTIRIDDVDHDRDKVA